MAPADRHRDFAANFTALVAGTPDWDVPSPVDGWTARDVVRHLVEWFPGFLTWGSGIELSTGPGVDTDPIATWRAQADGVQALLDDPATAGITFSNPHTGDHPVPDAIDRFYTTDVFMHSWDLARATGQDDGLDADECVRLIAEMEPIDELLRSSGQYGPQVPVAQDAPAPERMAAFIGRDPAWRAPA